MTELEKDIEEMAEMLVGAQSVTCESRLKSAEELAEKVRELEAENDELSDEVAELEERLAEGDREYKMERASWNERAERLSRERQEMKSQAYYMANALNACACAAAALGNLDAGQRTAAVSKCIKEAGVLARECAYARIDHEQNGAEPVELAERVAQAAKRFLVQTGELLAAVEDGEE